MTDTEKSKTGLKCAGEANIINQTGVVIPEIKNSLEAIGVICRDENCFFRQKDNWL